MSKRLLIMSQSKYFRDPRVLKESVVASENGFDVTSVCYYGDFDSDITEYKGVKIHRILNFGKREDFLDKFVKFSYHTFVWLPCYINRLKYKYFGWKGIFYMLYYRMRGKTRLTYILGYQQKVISYEITPNQKFESLHVLLSSIIYLYLFSNFDIYRYCRKFKVDIYHSTDLITLLAGLILKKTHFKTKLVYDAHELWIDSQINYPPKIKKVLYYYERFLIRRADEVITVNESIADELVKRYQIRRPTVVLNCPVYEESNNKRIDLSTVKVLYQGVYATERGLEELIQAFAYLDKNYVLYLRGYDTVPGYEDELKQYAIDNNIVDRVFFLPPVAMVDMVKSIDDYDIGVVPYRPTNLNQVYASPNKTFEYMMGGLAVAVSDIPEQRRFVVSNGVGLSFNPCDISDIARAIREIGNDKNRMIVMKNNALKCAKEMYNWNVQGDKIVKVYKEITK
jgi:glycogen synthase